MFKTIFLSALTRQHQKQRQLIVCSIAPMANIRALNTATKKRPLEGRVAVVTASTDGIGFAIARNLALDGARLLISSRKEANVQRAVEELRAEGLHDVRGVVCHVAKEEDRKRLLSSALKWFGPKIDIFVSNAAVNPAIGRFLDIMDTNMKAPFLLTKLLVPHMSTNGNGSVVYISSTAAYQAFNVIGAYSISKTALLALTKCVANECAEMNIRVNCVCPGLIKTRFGGILWKSEGAQEEIQRSIPLKRVGSAEEIAPVVTFLARDDSSYLTGESICVAGGYFTRL